MDGHQPACGDMEALTAQAKAKAIAAVERLPLSYGEWAALELLLTMPPAPLSYLRAVISTARLGAEEEAQPRPA